MPPNPGPTFEIAEAAAENLKNALYFSNLSVGRDTNNNARMTFFFDWQKMIQKNTRYAGLLKNTNKEIMLLVITVYLESFDFMDLINRSLILYKVAGAQLYFQSADETATSVHLLISATRPSVPELNVAAETCDSVHS